MKCACNRKKTIPGFTLVEILVAITMIAVIMATVFGTFTGVLSSSRNAERKVEIYQMGRSVMDILCADLRGFKPIYLPLEGVFFVGDLETVEGGLEASRADFITTHSVSMGINKVPFLSEVGYRIRRNPQGGLYSLWRRVQQSPEEPYGEGGREVPICRVLENFRLEFISNNDILSSLLNAAPSAVIVSFTLNLEGERERFVTMVRPMVER
ncbi:MAG: prepilin-type N-terminal cleavage/methylation domain-containing protein [Thermodesulfobacteriota bacterium]